MLLLFPLLPLLFWAGVGLSSSHPARLRQAMAINEAKKVLKVFFILFCFTIVNQFLIVKRNQKAKNYKSLKFFFEKNCFCGGMSFDDCGRKGTRAVGFGNVDAQVVVG